MYVIIVLVVLVLLMFRNNISQYVMDKRLSNIEVVGGAGDLFSTNAKFNTVLDDTGRSKSLI